MWGSVHRTARDRSVEAFITRLTAVFRARQALQATRVPMERVSAPLPASSAMDAPHSGLPCAHDVA